MLRKLWEIKKNYRSLKSHRGVYTSVEKITEVYNRTEVCILQVKITDLHNCTEIIYFRWKNHRGVLPHRGIYTSGKKNNGGV